MSQVPVELLVAAFTTENGADEALKKLQEANKEHLIHIQDAAVVRRDANDKLHINETAQWGAGKGAVVGALVGGAIGLIFPPSILVTGAVGAAIGGLAAKMRDTGFPDGRLKELGVSLKPGTSALVAVVEHTWVADLERQMAEQGAKTVREAINADIAAQLAQGHDVAYTATSTGDAMQVTRTAVGKDFADAAQMTVTDEGMVASKVVVDKDNVTAAGMVATQDAAAVVAMEGKLKPAEQAKPAEIPPAGGEAKPADASAASDKPA